MTDEARKMVDAVVAVLATLPARDAELIRAVALDDDRICLGPDGKRLSASKRDAIRSRAAGALIPALRRLALLGVSHPDLAFDEGRADYFRLSPAFRLIGDLLAVRRVADGVEDGEA